MSDGVTNADFEELAARLSAVEADRDRLAEALRTYGTHKTGCTMNALQQATAVECVCGLADALRDVDDLDGYVPLDEDDYADQRTALDALDKEDIE